MQRLIRCFRSQPATSPVSSGRRLSLRAHICRAIASAMIAAVLLPAALAQAGGSLMQGIAAYRHGNFVLAAACLAPFAQAGNPEAQAYMGAMYEMGRGVPQNYTQAALWYRRAADQGHTGAQYKLGLLYDRGLGVPQDNIEAEKWLILAAGGSDKEAADDRARIRDALRTKMTRGEIAQARQRAYMWGARPER